jgi:hypothetical protein
MRGIFKRTIGIPLVPSFPSAIGIEISEDALVEGQNLSHVSFIAQVVLSVRVIRFSYYSCNYCIALLLLLLLVLLLRQSCV